MYVADCRTCGYHEDFGMSILASEAAREHRARNVRPGKPDHEVGAFPLELWRQGEFILSLAAGAIETRTREAHTETAVGGAYATWRSYYAGLGFVLMPVRAPCYQCQHGVGNPAKCKSCRGGKRPLNEGWQEGGELVADMNVGIVTGSKSGNLVVLDFDEPGLVEHVLGFKPSMLADLTLVVKTTRGYHVYLRHGGVGNLKLIEGVDVRGEGGFVVAPPSRSATGHSYEIVPGRAMADRRVAPATRVLTPRLLKLLTAPRPEKATRSTPTPTPRGAGGVPLLAEGETPGDTSVPPVPDGHSYEVRPFSVDLAASYAASQAPALRAHWAILEGRRPPLSKEEGGRSKSDWVICLMLAEHGLTVGEIAGVLLQLPGSKAAERGATYALHTAERAWLVKNKRPRGGGAWYSEAEDAEA